jgi:hypothetical protein
VDDNAMRRRMTFESQWEIYMSIYLLEAQWPGLLQNSPFKTQEIDKEFFETLYYFPKDLRLHH